MEKGNFSLFIGSHIQLSTTKHGILCGFVADGDKAIIFDPDSNCFETHAISSLSVYNQSACSIPESMILILDRCYNTVDYKAQLLVNQNLNTSFDIEGICSNEGFLFEDELTTIPIATFLSNSNIYSSFMKNKPVVCLDSNKSLNCLCISVLPCKAIPSEFYHYFCEYTKPVYFTPQTHVYIYTIGAESTRISVKSLLPTACFFQSSNHNQCTVIETTSQSTIVNLSEAHASSFFTFAISPTLSVLSYYIFIREPEAIHQWTSAIQPEFSLLSMLNQFFHQPALKFCQNEILTLSSLLYYYIRSPARIHKNIVVGQSSLSLSLPYLRCFDPSVSEMYLVAKYCICSEKSRNCFYDDLSLVGSKSSEWLSLANQWMEGGGFFIRASDDNPITLTPNDRILYNQDILPVSTYFYLLENCMPSLYMSSGLLISQILSSTKQCYVIAVSLESLFQLVEYLITYYSDCLSIITLVYIDMEVPEVPSLASEIEIFNKLACIFRPPICDVPTPRYFNVQRNVLPPTIQESIDITPTTRLIRMNEVFYLCVCTTSQEDDIAFYNTMRSLNRFYHSMVEIEESVIPPLHQVISRVKQASSYVDMYLLGPFARDSIQTVSLQSPKALAQLVEQFDMLWACGYLINYMQFLQINGYASFFDTTTLVPVMTIPSSSRQEQYHYHREALISLFSLPEDAILPSFPSVPQYRIKPVANAVWSILPNTPSHSCLSLDEEPTCVYDSLSRVDDFSTLSLGECETTRMNVTLRVLHPAIEERFTPAELQTEEVDVNRLNSVQSLNEEPVEEILQQTSRPIIRNSYMTNESTSDSEEGYICVYTDSSEDSDSTDLGELICDRQVIYGYSPMEMERIKQLVAEHSERQEIDSSIAELSPSKFQINSNVADQLFRESMIIQPEKREERVSILKPAVDGEKEELAGMRIEQEIHRIEDPTVEEPKEPPLRRVPYHGDENEDIRREVTEISVSESFGLICSLLSQRMDSSQTFIKGTEKVMIVKQEAEEIPEDIIDSMTPLDWCDMGGSKDD